MVGKRSCLPRTTSSRSLLIPCQDADGDPIPFDNHVQVTEQSPSPALCSPSKIVIGFEVQAEKKLPSNVCESPRSVLESSAALSAQEKQQVVARSPSPSPRSGLGSLLAAKSDNEGNVGDFFAQAQMDTTDNRICHGRQKIGSPFKVTAWFTKASDDDDVPMDDDSFACLWQGLHGNLQADLQGKLLDVNISRIRAKGVRVHLHAEIKSDFDNNIFMGVNLNDSKHTFSDQQLVYSEDVGNRLTVPCIDGSGTESFCNSMHAPGHSMTLNFMHARQGNSSQKRCHIAGLDVEVASQHANFSALSPSSGFLKTCTLCGCSLRLGKDIFLYRGDQPFCSAECRYQKIVLHESKVRKGG